MQIKILLPGGEQVVVGEPDKEIAYPPRAPVEPAKVPDPSAPDAWSVYVDGTLRRTYNRHMSRNLVQMTAELDYPAAEVITICDHRN